MVSSFTACMLIEFPCLTLPWWPPQLQENDINPFNGKPYSQRYKDIMKKRKDLPVFQQMGGFTCCLSSR
jgi:hypothetical protein